MKSFTAVWVALVLLTGITVAGRAAAPLHLVNGWVLALAGIKASLVVCVFMQACRAHPVWRVVPCLLLAGILGIVALVVAASRREPQAAGDLRSSRGHESASALPQSQSTAQILDVDQSALSAGVR